MSAYKAFPHLYKRWLSEKIQNRLKRHFLIFDLAIEAQREKPQQTIEDSFSKLQEIHHEWAPGFGGQIYLPGPKERVGVQWCETLLKKKTLPDARQKIEIGTSLGPRSELSKTASYKTKMAWEGINPASILCFLIKYACESKLTDPGLKEKSEGGGH